MRTRINGYALSISVTAGLLAGCGVSQPSIGAPGTMPRSHPVATDKLAGERPATVPIKYETTSPLLYVTNFNPEYSQVVVYKANAADDPQPIAVIKEGLSEPAGDCIDGDGTLYVANQGGWVSEYALGETIPLRIITEGIDSPAFCAIDAHGNLWVTNIGPPSVVEYLKGSTTPHASISNGLSAPDGIAIDRAGNFYVGNLVPPSSSNIQVFSAGSTSPTRTITEGITWPVGIAVDAKNTLYVTNLDAPCSIEEYLAGQSQPHAKITHKLYGPISLTFGKHGRFYVVDDASRLSEPTAVLEYARPRSERPMHWRITSGLHDPEGVAYYPPLLP